MKWITKTLGVANLIFTALGIAYFIWIIMAHLTTLPGHPVGTEWIPFILIATTGLFLIFLLAFTGLNMIRSARRAVPYAALVYILEIVYFVFIVITWMANPSNNPRSRDLMVGFWGIAEGFLAPQLAIYYPFAGLVLLVIVAIGAKILDRE